VARFPEIISGSPEMGAGTGPRPKWEIIVPAKDAQACPGRVYFAAGRSRAGIRTKDNGGEPQRRPGTNVGPSTSSCSASSGDRSAVCWRFPETIPVLQTELCASMLASGGILKLLLEPSSEIRCFVAVHRGELQDFHERWQQQAKSFVIIAIATKLRLVIQEADRFSRINPIATILAADGDRESVVISGLRLHATVTGMSGTETFTSVPPAPAE